MALRFGVVRAWGLWPRVYGLGSTGWEFTGFGV